MLQAAGGEAFRAAKLLDRTAEDITPLENALIQLVRKAHVQPAMLTPKDLDSVRELSGDGALDYVQVIGLFHFINRIADLLHVSPEALPESLRRFESIRRFGVRAGSFVVSRMDLDNRHYEISYKTALKNITPVFNQAMGKNSGDVLVSLKTRPQLIEAFQIMLEEREFRSSLDREVIRTIQRTVEAALPKNSEEAEGFHTRPQNPIEAFAFIGTRYAYRATKDLINTLKQEGFDDLGIMDMAIAVADANQWARTHRLVGLEPELFYLK
jgi:alkylhydroperoxidase family enzyme